MSAALFLAPCGPGGLAGQALAGQVLAVHSGVSTS